MQCKIFELKAVKVHLSSMSNLLHESKKWTSIKECGVTVKKSHCHRPTKLHILHQQCPHKTLSGLANGNTQTGRRRLLDLHNSTLHKLFGAYNHLCIFVQVRPHTSKSLGI